MIYLSSVCNRLALDSYFLILKKNFIYLFALIFTNLSKIAKYCNSFAGHCIQLLPTCVCQQFLIFYPYCSFLLFCLLYIYTSKTGLFSDSKDGYTLSEVSDSSQVKFSTVSIFIKYLHYLFCLFGLFYIYTGKIGLFSGSKAS
jgi:hypothetical protein